jgi:hypothetical protein
MFHPAQDAVLVWFVSIILFDAGALLFLTHQVKSKLQGIPAFHPAHTDVFVIFVDCIGVVGTALLPALIAASAAA